MQFPVKIILGLLLVPALLAIVIFVSVHFTRQGKNESVSTGKHVSLIYGCYMGMRLIHPFM